MTTETFYEEMERAEAYLAGVRANVEDAKRQYRATLTGEDREALVEAVRTLRQAELDCYGISCPACEDGFHPHHGRICPECNGEGWVLPAHALNYLQRAGLSQADAREMIE